MAFFLSVCQKKIAFALRRSVLRCIAFCIVPGTIRPFSVESPAEAILEALEGKVGVLVRVIV